jgi:hypothetical protein
MGQPNPQQPVRLPKAETTWRALLQDGDLMAESQDLSLLSGTGPKRRGDQSQNGDEKWRHRGNDDDLTNRVKDCIFNPDGVFGIHRFWRSPKSTRALPGTNSIRFSGLSLHQPLVLRILRSGEAAAEIAEVARTGGFDLIVKPTHAGRFRRMLLGSTPAKMLNDAECPILTTEHAETKIPRVCPWNRFKDLPRQI